MSSDEDSRGNRLDRDRDSGNHRQNLFGDDEVEVSGSESGSDDERRNNRSGSRSDNEDAKKKSDKKEKKSKPKKTGPATKALLGEDHLTGKNGILRLPEIFKDFKFGGKGKESQDLDNVLNKIEHWVHVLHPRHPFDQTLERIEHLGSKKRAVKTYIKKIRMDLVSTATGQDDFDNLPDMGMSDDERDTEPNTNTVANDDSMEDNSANRNGASKEMEIDEGNIFDDDDDFDDLINTIPEDNELLSQLENNSTKPSQSASSDNDIANVNPNVIVVEDSEFDRMMAEAGM